MYTSLPVSSNRATLFRAAQPCTNCGTTSGRIPRKCYQPVRSLGLCERCYNAFMRHERGREGYKLESLPETPPEPEPGDPSPDEIAAACEVYREKRFRMPTGHGARMRHCSKIHRLRMGGGR